MNKRKSLGKGLQALIPALVGAVDGQDRLKEIDIEEIKPAARQPRQSCDQVKLAELADSIREHGVIQPVVVRSIADGGYELIAGERRWRACKILGHRTIPAVIKEYRDLEASAVSLIENVQREDLSPLEEAAAYRLLMDDFGLTQEEVSGRVGKSRPFVANMVRLLGLPGEIKDMIAEGKISAGHARALMAIQDGNKQVAAAGKIARLQLSVRQAENIARQLLEKKEKSSEKTVPGGKEILDAETKLKKLLGARVKIKPGRNGKGKLEIDFNSEADLKRILSLFPRERKG